MALPSALPISLSQVAVELGRASNAAVSMLETESLRLTGKSAGPVSMSDFANCMKFQLTAVTSGSNVGYFISPGAITQNSYRGQTIRLISSSTEDGTLYFLLTGTHSLNFFRGLWLNGVQYLTANAERLDTTSPTGTRWSWSNAWAIAAGTYDVYIG